MKTNQTKFMYAIGMKQFSKLSEAMEYAYEQASSDIYITKSGIAKLVYIFHPMSERFEQVYNVDKAKKQINKFLKNINI